MIPPDANAAFVAAMEDVLETYQKPRDPERPLVCLDETSKQLVIETRKPIPAKPGQPIRYDYEYVRNGVANIFMMFAPLEGWRKVKVTDHHAAVDYAQVLKELSDVHFADAKQIRLVQSPSAMHTHSTIGERLVRTSIPDICFRPASRGAVQYRHQHCRTIYDSCRHFRRDRARRSCDEVNSPATAR